MLDSNLYEGPSRTPDPAWDGIAAEVPFPRTPGRIPEAEPLLVRLRFDQELTLQQIAELAGLKDAQTADRRIREVLEKLRQELS